MKVIWLGIEPCDEILLLQEEIEDKLSLLGIKKDFKFFPHITLARVKIFDPLLRQNIGIAERLEFQADRFVLYQSILLPSGPEYKKIKEFVFS